MAEEAVELRRRQGKSIREIMRMLGPVIEIAPTLLEVAKLPQPKMVDGIKQTPMEGTSMMYIRQP